MRPIGLTVVLVVSLVVSLIIAPLTVEAQQPGKLYRIGILTNKASDPAEARLWQAFRSGLRERGWIEGQNIVLEFRAAEGNTARLPELAADLVRLKVDLIVARSSTFVPAAKEATSSIPIVFLIHADPVLTGHVTSLARPGGNITGLAIMMTDLAPKEIELLISAVPAAKRIAVLWSPDTPSHPSKQWRKQGARFMCMSRPSGRGPPQSWRAPSRPWPERGRRPSWCWATHSS
jgi:putative tryptophan/tyrosine transport system substrate-binding protein